MVKIINYKNETFSESIDIDNHNKFIFNILDFHSLNYYKFKHLELQNNIC